jgi:hypothetical protein
LTNGKEELVRYITKREFVEKLLIDIRERASEGQIRSAKEVMRDYFGFTVSSDDDDVIMKNFKSRAKKTLEDLIAITEHVEFFKSVDSKSQFSQIQKLPDMCDKFVKQCGALLEKEAKEMEPTVARQKRKNVSISNVAGARTYSIENELDIDKFLAEIKQKLMKELDEDTIITLS